MVENLLVKTPSCPKVIVEINCAQKTCFHQQQPTTIGDNEMGTHCSFANGSAKAFGAFAVKLRDNGDIHHVQALFVNKDYQVVPANYPAVARIITENFFPSKFKPEEPSNLSTDINRSLSAWEYSWVQDLW
eukprot:g73559.t1